MLQPNVTGDGDARLTVRFWVLVLATGVAAGLLGAAMMWILFTVEHAAFGVNGNEGGFTEAVARASGWQRATPLLIAGVFGGVAWYLLRRFTPGQKSEVDEVLWTGEGRLSVRRSLGTSVISEIVIGLGASLGREAAPKLLGAVSGSVFSGWLKMTPGQTRLLVACGAGAGLAAVYNVPLGGALFAAEVLIGSMNLPVVLPALLCSATATWVGWIYLPSHATYTGITDYAYDTRLLVWALVAGPIVGVLAAGYIRLIGWISHHRITGWPSLFAPLIAFGILAAIALAFPQLYGNGKGMAHDAFLGIGSLGLLAALAILKPLVTALCLGGGASGGLFTPVMSTGAVLGGALGALWSMMWPGSPIGAYAMIGAAAMIGAGMQAPLAALVLVLELTDSGLQLMVPMIVATAIATAITRWIDGYSIYSARLTAPAVPAKAMA
jgi:chloride channel protein, CIC family